MIKNSVLAEHLVDIFESFRTKTTKKLFLNKWIQFIINQNDEGAPDICKKGFWQEADDYSSDSDISSDSNSERSQETTFIKRIEDMVILPNQTFIIY